MQQNKAWLKFLITGNPKDYIDYKNKKDNQDYWSDDFAYYDRWPCDKGNEYKG